VISGTFRAFDRRPEISTRKTQQEHLSHGAGTSSQNATTVEKTSSSEETSYSGGDHADLPETLGSITWELIDGLEQPLWEWEQLNWL
jgi:hypothetical protein